MVVYIVTLGRALGPKSLSEKCRGEWAGGWGWGELALASMLLDEAIAPG